MSNGRLIFLTKSYQKQKPEREILIPEPALFVQVYSGNVDCAINLFFAFIFPSAFFMVIVSKVDIPMNIETVKSLAGIITTI